MCVYICHHVWHVHEPIFINLNYDMAYVMRYGQNGAIVVDNKTVALFFFVFIAFALPAYGNFRSGHTCFHQTLANEFKRKIEKEKKKKTLKMCAAMRMYEKIKRDIEH